MSDDTHIPAPSARPPVTGTGKLRQVEAALRHSEAKHEALLIAIPDLILGIREDGTLVECQVGELMPYWPREQLLGRKVSEVVPAEVADRTLFHMGQALQTGKIQVFEYQLTALGRVRDFEARMAVSGPQEALLIIREITEKKWAEKETLQRERLAALGLLATTLAHEINNPLQIIKNHLDLLTDFPLQPTEQEKYLRIIRSQVERLNAVTQRALRFARPQPAPREPVALARLVRHVISFVGQKLRDQNIQVTLQLYPTPLVLAAPDQLEQVLLNLVINAIEAAPAEGGHIRFILTAAGEQVTLAVISHNPPIPAEALAHIFEAFYTTRPDGHGLGLWISRDIVEQHRGTLTIENQPDGRGVVVTLKLPRAPETA